MLRSVISFSTRRCLKQTITREWHSLTDRMLSDSLRINLEDWQRSTKHNLSKPSETWTTLQGQTQASIASFTTKAMSQVNNTDWTQSLPKGQQRCVDSPRRNFGQTKLETDPSNLRVSQWAPTLKTRQSIWAFTTLTANPVTLDQRLSTSPLLTKQSRKAKGTRTTLWGAWRSSTRTPHCATEKAGQKQISHPLEDRLAKIKTPRKESLKTRTPLQRYQESSQASCEVTSRLWTRTVRPSSTSSTWRCLSRLQSNEIITPTEDSLAHSTV